MDESRSRSASDLYTYDCPTDSDILSNKLLPTRILFDSNTHKLENINYSFRFYTNYAILNRELEFPAISFGLKCVRTFLTPTSCKYEVTPTKEPLQNVRDRWRH